MDTQSQERLLAIIATGPDSITAADADFLRARRSYLNEEQRAVFSDILSGSDGSTSSQPEKVVNHVISQNDLDNNPGLAQDVNVGDVVQLPADVTSLEDMTRVALSEIAESLGLPSAGAFESKVSVIARIRAAQSPATVPQQ